jgi:hypothetical protein
MARLTITDAARVTGVSRMLLYRYIKSGKLSRTPEGLIDTAELLRVGLMLQTSNVKSDVTLEHDVTPSALTPATNVTSPVTSAVTPPVTPTERSETRTLERLITVLQRELDAARERETLLLQMLSQLQQQNQRLLDLPRTQEAPGPTPPPSPVPRAPAPPRPPQAHAGDSRGAMRRRILDVLQEHPEGLTPSEIQTVLGVDRSLVDTCQGMLRYGLVQQVGRGRYIRAEPPRTNHKDILMTLFVGNSACTDDQRADTLTYHLAILTQSVSFALVHLEALLQEPGSPDRDRRLGAILYALERINTKAMQLGLGKGLEGISHEKQRLETLVARQRQERKVSP